MDEFTREFVDESQESIRELSSALLDLEQEPDDTEAMDAIFRTAHTLKGNAGAMGFNDMSNLAHAMEDVLDEIRSDNLEVTTEVIDLLFDGLDLIEQMMDEMKDNGQPQSDPSETIDALRSYIEDAEGDDTGEEVETSDDGDTEGSDDGVDLDPDDCLAITDDGTQCENSPQEDSDYCHVHQYLELDDPTEDEIDALVDPIEPDDAILDLYYVRISVTHDADDQTAESEMPVVDTLDDAFTVYATDPPKEEIRDGEYEDVFDAIVDSPIGEEQIAMAMDEVDQVRDVNITNITDSVDWISDESLEDDFDFDDEDEDLDDEALTLEDEDEDGDMDDVDVDELLEEESEFDDLDSIDEDDIDDVGVDDFGDDGGVFGDDDDSESSDDGEDLSDVDNEGAQMFDELQGEVDEADDFTEVEEEMEDMDFDFGDDDDEVEFDDLVDEDDGPGFDEGSSDEAGDELLDDDEEFDPEEESDLDLEASKPDLSGGDDAGMFEEDDEDVEVEDTGVAGTGDELFEDDELEDGDADLGSEFDDADSDDMGVEEDTSEPAEASASTGESDEGEGEGEEGIFGSETGSEDVEIEEADEDDASDVFGTDTDFGSAFDSDDDGLDDLDELLGDDDRQASDRGSEEDLDIQSVRVDVDQLDELYTLVQELVTNRIRLNRALDELDVSETELSQAFNELDELETITGRMQDTVMNIRLVPLEHATNRLPRIARDVARENSKEVDFEIEGEDVELDRGILSQLGDPLMHLVRNAVDHGIEDPDVREARGKDRRGKVKVSARRSRDRVTITVEDDGDGIEADRIREEAVNKGLLTPEQAKQLSDEQAYELIFRPGFTTKEEVTETSGRGVGMDVVYDTIRGVDGSVSVQSEPGEGTQVSIRVPVSLAILQVLFVRVDGEEYGIPIKNISEVGRVENIEEIEGEEAYLEDGETYPLIRLNDALNVDDSDEIDETGRLLKIDSSVRKVALLCDSVGSHEEVVVEPYDGVLSSIPGFSGAAVLGEGDVVNIIDVETL